MMAQAQTVGSAPVDADLNCILDGITLPIIVVDHTSVVVRFNRAATTLFGLTAAHLGQRLSDVPALAQIKDVQQLCMRALSDGAPCRSEFRNGDRWFTLNIAPCNRSDGQFNGAVITCTNVTAFRASVEQAIYEREYTKTILNTVDIALVTLDSQLRVQTANRTFYQLFGISREAAHRVPLLELADHDWKCAPLWDALRGPIPSSGAFETLEVECDFPTLGRRTLLVDARPLPLAAHPAFLLALQDITARKRAENALQESEERYRVLFTSMDEGFCTIEVLFDENHKAIDYRFLEVNRAFERQTGIKEAKGKLMRQIAPAHGEHWFEIYGNVALTGESVRFENQASELQRWYDVYAFRIGPPGSNQVAVLFSDITQRKQTEEALKEADRRKDQFLATLAHELRNPLAPIRNSLEIIRQSRSNPVLLERAHTMIDRQTLHMQRLVDDLLDISRITSDKLELRRERVDLNAILVQSIELYRPLAERAGITLTSAVPVETIHLEGDPVRLAQLFGNLLNNACKYSDPGGRISVNLQRDERNVIVRVADTGVGIPPDMLHRIFEMFTQVEGTLKHSKGGLGIGLNLAKRLVHMHGGTIEAFSEGSGRGSEFVVRLPLTTSLLTRASTRQCEKNNTADSG
jgi:PAS domain S-box-containing protein